MGIDPGKFELGGGVKQLERGTGPGWRRCHGIVLGIVRNEAGDPKQDRGDVGQPARIFELRRKRPTHRTVDPAHPCAAPSSKLSVDGRFTSTESRFALLLKTVLQQNRPKGDTSHV